MKRLYRSKTDRMLCGVCGGIASHLDVDPTIVRLIVAFVAIWTAVIPALIIYFVACLIIPEQPAQNTEVKEGPIPPGEESEHETT